MPLKRPPTSPAANRPRLYNLFIFWHLLSLDAPTIAVLWTLFPAHIAHVAIPFATPLAMGLAVWTLYAADRLLDTSHLPLHCIPHSALDLEPRHLFHHRHRSLFLMALAATAILLAILLPRLAHAATHLYLTEAALMAGYFFLIHAAPAQPRALPKELLVGLFFAAATFIPTISRAPSLRPALLPCALLFAALCTLNCLYIYAWEHPVTLHPHRPTRAAIRFLPYATVTLLLLTLTLIFLPARVPHLALYPAACALSIVVLLLLHRFRDHLSRLTLRTAADAALLTPILFLPFL